MRRQMLVAMVICHVGCAGTQMGVDETYDFSAHGRHGCTDELIRSREFDLRVAAPRSAPQRSESNGHALVVAVGRMGCDPPLRWAVG